MVSLILTVGEQPLPVVVSILALHEYLKSENSEISQIYLLPTNKTLYIAENRIKKFFECHKNQEAQKLNNKIHIHKIDPSSIKQVQDSINKCKVLKALKSSSEVIINYTSGTQLMAIGLSKSFKASTKSYLDARNHRFYRNSESDQSDLRDTLKDYFTIENILKLQINDDEIKNIKIDDSSRSDQESNFWKQYFSEDFHELVTLDNNDAKKIENKLCLGRYGYQLILFLHSYSGIESDPRKWVLNIDTNSSIKKVLKNLGFELLYKAKKWGGDESRVFFVVPPNGKGGNNEEPWSFSMIYGLINELEIETGSGHNIFVFYRDSGACKNDENNLVPKIKQKIKVFKQNI